MKRFYLGTHEQSWLKRLKGIPLFMSRRRLARLKNLYPSVTRWACDSGGFTELNLHGEWKTSESQYVEELHRYHEEVGRLDWAAPQDWMCEPFVLEKTGLTIEEHQRRTTASVISLRDRLPPRIHVIPVLQGFHLEDYLTHLDQYEREGFHLAQEKVVGVGSVCRRQGTDDAADIFRSLQARGLKLHGFGLKKQAIRKYGHLLHSADSMAWSYAGRRKPDPNCPKKSCSNCLHYALAWRDNVLSL